MSNTRRVAALVTMALMTSVASADPPGGVSPGAGDRFAAIRDDCPTFSWEAEPDAAFYEVTAYAVPAAVERPSEVELTQDNEVLYIRIPGGATTWTPELGSCFTPGGHYVWFVRAARGGEPFQEFGEWSRGLFFSVTAIPSAEEVWKAMGTLQRYLRSDHDGEGPDTVISGGGTGAVRTDWFRRTPMNTMAARVLPGSSAIKGEMPEPTGQTFGTYGVTNSSTDGAMGTLGEAKGVSGEIYGVGGITYSPAGAGVVAFNAAGATDLLLGADEYSAHVTELGITRAVPGPATFDISNPDASGSMTLQVDGADVVTTLTDADTLGELSCADGEIARWDGSVWMCAEDLDTVGSLACAEGEVAEYDGLAWSCAPGFDLERLGLRGSRIWLLTDWYQGTEITYATQVKAMYFGTSPVISVSCLWYEGGSLALSQSYSTGPGGQVFCNTQGLGRVGFGWMAVVADEPVFVVASRLRSVVGTSSFAHERNVPVIPIDCSSPQGLEFVCATIGN